MQPFSLHHIYTQVVNGYKLEIVTIFTCALFSLLVAKMLPNVLKCL